MPITNYNPVAFSATDTTGSGTGGNMAFNNVSLDTHNAFSGGIYTIPVAGEYSMNAHAWVGGNTAPSVMIFKNGSGIRGSVFNRVSNDTISGGITNVNVQCAVGDQITVQVSGGFTLSNVSQNYVNIHKIGA